MNAVCYKCGSTKLEPQRACGNCSELPASEESITQSFMLSTHCMDHEMLEQMGELIKGGGVMPELPDSVMEPLREEARIFRRLETELKDARCVDEAVRLYREGDSDSAYAILEGVVARIPPAYRSQIEERLQRYVRFWDEASYCHYMEWHVRHAVEYERPIVRLPCTYPRAYYWLGQIELDKRNLPAAEMHFLDGRRLEPENPVFNFMLALVYGETDRHSEAVVLLDEIGDESEYADHKMVAETLMMKARYLVELERFEEGMAAYRSALPYGPDKREAKWFLAYLCIKRSNYLRGESHG